MVVVKWSVFLPFTPTIQVRIQLKLKVFSVNFVTEKNENKQKRGRGCVVKPNSFTPIALLWPFPASFSLQ